MNLGGILGPALGGLLLPIMGPAMLFSPGSEAPVAISESSSDETPNAFISHVAAVSWADTQTPETTLGSHSPTKAGFLSANHTDVFCFGSPATCHK